MKAELRKPHGCEANVFKYPQPKSSCPWLKPAWILTVTLPLLLPASYYRLYPPTLNSQRVKIVRFQSAARFRKWEKRNFPLKIYHSPSSPLWLLVSYRADLWCWGNNTGRRVWCSGRTGSRSQNNTLSIEPRMNQNDRANLATNSLSLAVNGAALWMGGYRSAGWGKCELNSKRKIHLDVHSLQSHLLHYSAQWS